MCEHNELTVTRIKGTDKRIVECDLCHKQVMLEYQDNAVDKIHSMDG